MTTPLTRNELVQLAQGSHADLRALSRDYVLTHLIERLSLHPDSELFTFKGGTALRLVHFDEFRFSADIDLNVKPACGLDVAHGILGQVCDETQKALGFNTMELAGGAIHFAHASGEKPSRIKLDISETEIETAPPVRRTLIARYRNQQPGVESLPTYSLEQAAAEKFRCVVERLQCRDLYDLHHLFVEEGVDPIEAWAQFTRKALSAGGTDHEDRFRDKWVPRLERYQARWEDEMSAYVGEVPDFDALKRQLSRELRRLPFGL